MWRGNTFSKDAETNQILNWAGNIFSSRPATPGSSFFAEHKTKSLLRVKSDLAQFVSTDKWDGDLNGMLS